MCQTKKCMNNDVVNLTDHSIQKTFRLKHLYFFKGAKYYSTIFIESKLGTVGSQKLQMDAQIKKKDILPIIRTVSRSRAVKETNKTIKNLKNSEFWKISKFQNYLAKYLLSLIEISKVNMLF